MVTLQAGDLVALTIALTASLIVIITPAFANYRLTESRNYWRYQYEELSHYLEHESF